MELTPDEVASNIYGALLRLNSVVLEHEIRKHYEETEGKNALNLHLNQIGMSLPEVLKMYPNKFGIRGPGRWQAVAATAHDRELIASMTDKKNKGARSRNRGGAGSVRGRGPAIPRTHPDNGFKHANASRRGVSHFRGSVSTHGSVFRPQPSHHYPPPPASQEFPGQRPLRPRVGPGPSDGARGGNNQDPPGWNMNYDGPGPRSPPYRYSSRSPPRSPSRDSFNNQPYRDPQDYNNGPRDIDYGRRDYNQDRNYGNDLGFNNPYRRRSPSPRFQRSPSPRNNYQNYRTGPGYDRASNSRNFNDYDSQRNYSPPRQNYRNDIPSRPDSRASNGSGFSQFSGDTNVASMTSSAKERSRARAAAPLNQSTPIEDLAQKFNASATLSEPPSLVLPSVEVDKVGKKVAKNLKAVMELFGGERALLEDLICGIEKEIEIPGRNVAEKESYLVTLKENMPDYLRCFDINTDESYVEWKDNASSSGKITSNIAHPDYKEDELHDFVVQHVENIPNARFKLTDEIDFLISKTNASRALITEKLTYVLFRTYRQQYHYVDGSTEYILKVGSQNEDSPAVFRSQNDNSPGVFSAQNDNSPALFRAPLEHNIIRNITIPSLKIKVEIGRFLKFEKFAVRPVDYLEKFELLDKEIQVLMSKEERNLKDVPATSWKANHGCLVKIKDPKTLAKWGRGIVIRTEAELFRVYLLDMGYWVLVKSSDLKLLPAEFCSIPPYAIPCSLDADEDDLMELSTQQWKDTISNYSDRTCISIQSRSEITDGIKTFYVKLFVKNLNDTDVDIVDFQQ